MTAPPRLVIKYLIEEAARIHRVSPEDITGKSKYVPYVHARWSVCYVLRARWRMRYTAIGAAMGYADHTTAIHAARKTSDHMRRDPEYRKKITRLARAEVPGARRYRTEHPDYTSDIWVPDEIKAMPEWNVSQLPA